MCIEIKKTADPFIFYCNKRGAYEGGVGYGLFHWKNNVNNKVFGFREIEKQRPLRQTEYVARSYSCFKDRKTQHIQSGILSAFKAAIHGKEHCDETYSDLSGDICFFVPILVVDGPLYECYFEEGSDVLTAREVQEIVYRQNYHSEQYGRVTNTVFVVNMLAFAAMVEAMSRWGEHMISVMVENRANVVKLEAK